MGRKKQVTAFPVARIKKMMQSDEDVGKIATATPLLVSKALELVMEDLLKKSAAIALERKGRTISPQHLKECVNREESFDFLRKTFAKVSDLGPVVEKKLERKALKKENTASTSASVATQAAPVACAAPTSHTAPAAAPSPPTDPNAAPKRKRGRPAKAETLEKNRKLEAAAMSASSAAARAKQGRPSSPGNAPMPTSAAPSSEPSNAPPSAAQQTAISRSPATTAPGEGASAAVRRTLSTFHPKANASDDEDYDEGQDDNDGEELDQKASPSESPASADGAKPTQVPKNGTAVPSQAATAETVDPKAGAAQPREEPAPASGVTKDEHSHNQKRISVQSLIM